MPAKGVTLTGSSREFSQIFMMKHIALAALCLFRIGYSQNLQDTTTLSGVEITSIRAGEKTPVAKSIIRKEEIERTNTGVDLPFILANTPSIIAYSDAGNGVGYTGLRVRGSDASRVNVTINGVPFNDAESQGTFFVDLPDLLSSTGSIQVQRGAGSSTNGPGAFGASVNISTNEISERSVELNNAAGSYGTIKNTVVLNTGKMGDLSLSGRLSNIMSDGYIDRASSGLQSFYTSAFYAKRKHSIRLNIFSGREKTYQAWNGVPEYLLKTNRTYNSAGTEKDGTPYKDEVDRYTQTHYQLFYNTSVNRIKAGIGAFLIRGKGYYQQYKSDEDLEDYGVEPYFNGSELITTTDLERRLWLDNYYYGTIFSAEYNNARRSIIAGGNISFYDGKHYGQVLASDVPSVPKDHRWYSNNAEKNDAALFIKYTERISRNFYTYLDLQGRKVLYDIYGFRNSPSIIQKNEFSFFNPKAGLTYQEGNHQSYISYSRASKEPNRDDFESASERPRPEYLDDFEAGYRFANKRWSAGVNFFYMLYKDQLVLTGRINDVGAYTRTNIKSSFRRGVELEGTYKLGKLSAAANLTMSENRVKDFTEFLDDYDNGGQQTKFYRESPIAFSPSATSLVSVNYKFTPRFEAGISNRTVSRQYMDNTGNKARSLDPYTVTDLRLAYRIRKKKSDITLFTNFNNIFSQLYEANGYTFSYYYGNELVTENFYYPMAPFNFMAGVNIKLK